MASEQLVMLRDSNGGNAIVGEVSIVGSSGPDGTLVTTRGWDATAKRQRKRDLATGTGINHFQAFSGVQQSHDYSALFPLQGAPSGLIMRIRDSVAAEYVSGSGVSRVAFGLGINWSNLLLGAPATTLDDGFIGFLWYQVGAVSTNWRAVAAAHDGTNLFDVDTGIVGPGIIPYNLRVDFDGRVGQRNITWFIDEVQVAQFTPGNNLVGGTDTSPSRVFVGVNAQNGNVCASHYEMFGEVAQLFFVQPGAPTT